MCEEAFRQLKTSLITAPVLVYPDPQRPFILDTDASDFGIGAVLSQEGEGGIERVVAYASRTLTKEERKYAATKKELLSMVCFTKYFKHYLLGKEFILRTDHSSLRWLHNFQGLEGQLARWVEQLAAFQYKIIHRPGKQHTNADALSRRPPPLSEAMVVKSSTVSLEKTEPSDNICVVHIEAQTQTGGLEIGAMDDISKAQREDTEISLIISLMQDPTGGVDVWQEYPELKKYQSVWEQLEVQGQRLVRVPPSYSDAAPSIQVVLPSSMVMPGLQMLHSSRTGGHLGIQKLQAKVKDRFFWPGWFGDVRQFCRACPDCASRRSHGLPPRAPLNPSVASRPMERLAVDILGPLPETLRKSKYILVVGDYFSKWTEAYALPNQEAESLAKVLVEQWVCRFGAPRSIHSDQGRNFESTLFKEMCQLLSINKTRRSPNHPESNGMVERFNRTLLSMLALFVDDNQLNWDVLLPYVLMAYRSSVHASTGFTPYKVLFGQEIILPVDVMWDMGHQERFSAVSDYVVALTDTLSTVVGAVKRHQERASAQQKAAYDFRVNHQYYAVGELVWVQNKVRKKGRCPKLQRRYKGPFKVLEIISDVLYRVCLPEGGAEMVVHFNRLKPFVHLSATGNPPGALGNHPVSSHQPADPAPMAGKAVVEGGCATSNGRQCTRSRCGAGCRGGSTGRGDPTGFWEASC